MMPPLDVVHVTSSYSKPRGDSRRPKLKATVADLESWLAVAAAGDAIEYHRGVLAMDRSVGSRLGEADRKELGRVADVVMTLASLGQVQLVQRRHGADDYTYIAIGSGSPKRCPESKSLPEATS